MGREVTLRLLRKSSAVDTRNCSIPVSFDNNLPFVKSVDDHWNPALMKRGYGIAFVGGFQISQQGHGETQPKPATLARSRIGALSVADSCLANVLLPTAADASMKMISF